MYSTLSVEITYRLRHVSPRKLFYGFFERWVSLAHYLIKVRCLHPRLL